MTSTTPACHAPRAPSRPTPRADGPDHRHPRRAGRVTQPRRIANATLGDYLVPVNADVPDIDVVFVGKPDPLTPLGAKGVGEIGLLGIAAAVANAIYHATGRRIRSLPITVEELL